MNIDFSNLKKYRVIIVTLVVLIFFLVVLLILTASTSRNVEENWIEREEQNPAQIEDVRLAMPYYDVDFSIFYSEDEKLFSVSYPGYKLQEEIEAKVVRWFKLNANGIEEIRVKYGGIAGEIKSYDLNNSLDKLLENNEYYKRSFSEDSSNMEVEY